MKKKLIKLVPVLILLITIMSGCINVWDEMRIEHTPRPVVEIDTISVPPWEEQILLNQTNSE